MKKRSVQAWIAFGLSAVLHVALLWHYTLPHSESPAPLGNWVEMVPGAKPDFRPSTRSAQHSAPSPVNAPVENKLSEAPAPSSPSAVVGNSTQSTGLSGPVGDLNGVQVSVRERYLYELESYLNQLKTYPSRARHLQQSGNVEVGFHLHGDGSITDAHVVRPCIHDLLNESALALVSSARQFRPIPTELGVTVLHVTVPIRYELN
jgi:TonB family protein